MRPGETERNEEQPEHWRSFLPANTIATISRTSPKPLSSSISQCLRELRAANHAAKAVSNAFHAASSAMREPDAVRNARASDSRAQEQSAGQFFLT